VSVAGIGGRTIATVAMADGQVKQATVLHQQ
jgi:prepilin-type processing-associated H-X9-DG protein